MLKCTNASTARAYRVVANSVSGGPREGPGGPNGPQLYYLKYALPST